MQRIAVNIETMADPERVAAMVQNEVSKLNIDKAVVACLGLTYKADVDDMRAVGEPRHRRAIQDAVGGDRRRQHAAPRRNAAAR